MKIPSRRWWLVAAAATIRARVARPFAVLGRSIMQEE
jgi:hypothetical protein